MKVSNFRMLQMHIFFGFAKALGFNVRWQGGGRFSDKSPHNFRLNRICPVQRDNVCTRFFSSAIITNLNRADESGRTLVGPCFCYLILQDSGIGWHFSDEECVRVLCLHCDEKRCSTWDVALIAIESITESFGELLGVRVCLHLA